MPLITKLFNNVLDMPTTKNGAIVELSQYAPTTNKGAIAELY